MSKNANADQGIPQPASHKFGQVGPFRHGVNLVPFHTFGEENYMLITFYEDMGGILCLSNFPDFHSIKTSIYHAPPESLFYGAPAGIPGPNEIQGRQHPLIY